MNGSVSNLPGTRRRLSIALFAAAVATSLTVSAEAGNQSVGSTDTIRAAGIYAGTCDDRGDLAFQLRDLVVGPDSRGALQFVGASNASVVESSETEELAANIDTLTASPHVIAVFESGEESVVIACGEIGGFMVSGDDDLAIGLRQANDSGFAGVALLDGDDDDNELDVDVYLARDAVIPAGA